MQVSNVTHLRGQVVQWPGQQVRDTHAALLRAERVHDRTHSAADWAEVQTCLRAYIAACQAEGIEA